MPSKKYARRLRSRFYYEGICSDKMDDICYFRLLTSLESFIGKNSMYATCSAKFQEPEKGTVLVEQKNATCHQYRLIVLVLNLNHLILGKIFLRSWIMISLCLVLGFLFKISNSLCHRFWIKSGLCHNFSFLFCFISKI